MTKRHRPNRKRNKELQREYARRWREKNREKLREADRKRYHDRRKAFFKDKACIDCGSKERLELDHIDRKDKTSHHIWLWSEERRLAEIAKCVVRCYDCHRKRHREDFIETGKASWLRARD